MKIEKPFIMLGLLVLSAIYACGGASLPQGAQKIGHYEGFSAVFQYLDPAKWTFTGCRTAAARLKAPSRERR